LGLPTIPSIEDKLTIDPPKGRFFFIALMACLVPRKTPFQRFFVRRAESADAGAVYQDVETAEPFDGGGDQMFPVGFLCHVVADENRAGDAIRDPIALGFVDIGEDYICSFLCQHPGGCLPQAARGAGDNGDFILNPSCHLVGA
jgi:hypothetical protein